MLTLAQTPRQRRQKFFLLPLEHCVGFPRRGEDDVITHKYRGSQKFSISKSVEPNEELKVEQIFPQVLSTLIQLYARLTFALPRTSMKLEVLCRCDRKGLQDNKEHVNIN